MESKTESKFLKEPVKKLFGWSYYTEKKDTSYEDNGKVLWVQSGIIKGKKFCFLRAFLFDYQIEIKDFEQYKPE